MKEKISDIKTSELYSITEKLIDFILVAGYTTDVSGLIFAQDYYQRGNAFAFISPFYVVFWHQKMFS